MSDYANPRGHALLAQLAKNMARHNKEPDPDKRKAMFESDEQMMKAGLLELGFSESDYRRVKAVCNETALSYHDKVIEAVRLIGAVGHACRFAPFVQLAHAAFDDLNEVARIGRRMDMALGAVDLDDGKGGFCPWPVRLDPEVTEVTHMLLDNLSDKSKVDAFDRLLTMVGAKINKDHTGKYTPMTLMALVVSGEQIAKALAPLTVFGASGNLATVRALDHVLTEQAVAAAEGKRLNDLAGENNYYWYDELRQVHHDAMRESLAYILEHGSDEGFDAAAQRRKLEAAVDAMGPEAQARFRQNHQKAEAKLRDLKQPRSPFHTTLKS